MNITTDEFKSLPKLSFKVPEFTIITGKNGSGKTQLLQAIARSNSVEGRGVNIPKSYIKYIPVKDLVANEESISDPKHTTEFANRAWTAFDNARSQTIRTGTQNIDSIKLSSLMEFNRDYSPIIGEVLIASGKTISQLTNSDFIEFYPTKSTDPFTQNLANQFRAYYHRKEQNAFNQWMNEAKGDKSYEFLSDEEFDTKFGMEPWKLLNQMLDTMRLNYEVKAPANLKSDASFELRFTQKATRSEVSISNFSSGEKTLLILCLMLYNNRYGTNFPSLLLLDEPDAFLHPSMTKQFMDTIFNFLVQEKRISVIITTHSPSTVAMAPPDSVYMLRSRDSNISLDLVPVDAAIRSLISGVPSISVIAENRRQVFVESTYDRNYYELIYTKLSSVPEWGLLPEISLTFISSGESDLAKSGNKISNCEQVVKIVTLLREGGNRFIWGIIDWDTTNDRNRHDFVITNGFESRYNIESYLFDPILLAALLLDRRLIAKAELGIPPNEHHLFLSNMSAEELQTVCDTIVQKIRPHLKNDHTGHTAVTMMNGLSINVPNWYLHHQGHQLEDAILKVYPGLNAIKRDKEALLKTYIIEHIIDDFPGLLSIDFLMLFLQIQDS